MRCLETRLSGLWRVGLQMTRARGREGEEQSRVFKLEDCQKILDIFKSHGHTELDTARAYGAGSSEEYLRDLGAEKQGFKIATKVSKIL